MGKAVEELNRENLRVQMIASSENWQQIAYYMKHVLRIKKRYMDADADQFHSISLRARKKS